MRSGLPGIGELAKRMLLRAFAAGVPAEWVVGDTVSGYEELRIWLDERQKHYVLAVPETHAVWVQGRQQPVGLLAALLPPQAWVVLSAGEGSKGPRLYEWAWLQLPDETEGPHERALPLDPAQLGGCWQAGLLPGRGSGPDNAARGGACGGQSLEN